MFVVSLLATSDITEETKVPEFEEIKESQLEKGNKEIESEFDQSRKVSSDVKRKAKQK
jgi:hypothetical protein